MVLLQKRLMGLGWILDANTKRDDGADSINCRLVVNKINQGAFNISSLLFYTRCVHLLIVQFL